MGLFRRTKKQAAQDESLAHCPFCGSGNIVGGSDGTASCGYCNRTFEVVLRPDHPSMPKTVDGQPIPGQPEQVDQSIPAANQAPTEELDPAAPATPGGLESYRVDNKPAPDAPVGGLENFRSATFHGSGQPMGLRSYLDHLVDAETAGDQ